jgi:hypothetical protein
MNEINPVFLFLGSAVMMAVAVIATYKLVTARKITFSLIIACGVPIFLAVGVVVWLMKELMR